MKLADEEKIQILNSITIDRTTTASENIVFTGFNKEFLPLDSDSFLVLIQQDRQAPTPYLD
jgi:hypothetical protein